MLARAKTDLRNARFGSFELDFKAGKLFRRGHEVLMQPRPFDALAMLVQRAGETVGRHELIGELWHVSEHISYDDHLGQVIRKVRQALGDSARDPDYIETIAARNGEEPGFRFIGQVVRVDSESSSVLEVPAIVQVVEGVPPAILEVDNENVRPSHPIRWYVLLLLLLAGGAATVIGMRNQSRSLNFASHDNLLIGDFENQTGDAGLNDALVTGLTVALEQSNRADIFPRARAAPILQRMGKPSSTLITHELGVEICQREGIRALISGSIFRAGQKFVITAQLINPTKDSTVKSYSERVDSEDELLVGLDRISRSLRSSLGESLAAIGQADRPLPAVTTSSMLALKQYAQGLSLWRSGKYFDAMAQYRLAVATDPSFAMAHAAIGNAAYGYIFNDPVEGKKEYEKAIALSSQATEREREYILINYAGSANHAADQEFLLRSFLRSYPDDWAMLMNYAHLLRTHGRVQEAIPIYRRMIEIAPDDSASYVDLATSLKTLGNYPEAIKAYEKAFQLSPDQNQFVISREYGFTLVANGEEAKARQLFSKQLENKTTREAGLRSLGLLDVLYGHCDSAERRFAEALTLDEAEPAPLSVARMHLWLGYLADLQGDKKRERRELNAAAEHLDTLGQKVIMGAWIGQSYARTGDVHSARRILNTITPAADHGNKQQMGYLHLLTGEIATAEGDTQSAFSSLLLSQQEGEDEGMKSFYLGALADASLQHGQTQVAADYYEKVVAIRRDSILNETLPIWLRAHTSLARIYLAQGHPDKAKVSLDELLAHWKQADPTLPLLREALSLERSVADANTSSQGRNESKYKSAMTVRIDTRRLQ